MSKPQKNNGKRAAAKVSKASKKNNFLVADLLDDLKGELEENILIARVIKRLGNGRMQVFYTTKNEDGTSRPNLDQASIRGNMRGKSKRSLWIEIGSIVIVSKSDIGGSREFEIIGIIEPERLDEVKEAAKLEPRVLAVDITDEASLMMAIRPDQEDGFVFVNAHPEEDDVDVDNI
jgi:hypothetical protein